VLELSDDVRTVARVVMVVRGLVVRFRFPLEVRGDFFERFVLGFGQIVVEVHEAAEAQHAEPHERVVEADELFEI